MIMNLRTRIQTWLADHNMAQYPYLRRVTQKPDWHPYKGSKMVDVDRSSGKARVSWFGQGMLAVYAIVMIPVALFFIVIGSVIVYVVASSF
jgi:hypothetical protein